MSTTRDAAWARLLAQFAEKPPQTKGEHVRWKEQLENAAQAVARAEREDTLWEVLRALHHATVAANERDGIDQASEIVMSLDPAVQRWDDERMAT